MSHKADALDYHIERLVSAARSVITDGKGRSSARINCHEVICQVTPKVSHGDYYVLFYRDGKRTSRGRLHDELSVTSL